jgi:hypothetical protein
MNLTLFLILRLLNLVTGMMMKMVNGLLLSFLIPDVRKPLAVENGRDLLKRILPTKESGALPSLIIQSTKVLGLPERSLIPITLKIKILTTLLPL